MAAGELTERQQEIKALLDAGKTPGEIAKELDISENGVYQHIRRMRQGGTTVSTSGGRRRARGGKSAAKPQARPAPAVPSEPRAMTPLQAIRARKHEIEVELREHNTAVTHAESALKKATELRDTASAKRADEIKQLDTAEAALTGKPAPRTTAPRKRTAARKSGAKRSATKPSTSANGGSASGSSEPSTITGTTPAA